MPDDDTRPLIQRLYDGAMSRRGSLAPNRSPEGSPTGIPSAGEETPLLDTSEAVEEPQTGTRGIHRLSGPRGRDEQGQWLAVPPGLPAGQAGEPRIALPKGSEFPEIPEQVQRFVDVPVTVATGRLLERDAGFPVRCIRMDNYSKQWLYVPSTGHYVPPYTVLVQFPIATAATKVQVDAAAPPGITQPALAATQQVFLVTALEREHEFSPGIAVTNAGVLP